MGLQKNQNISPPSPITYVHRGVEPMVDPRYQQCGFRKTQAERWVNFFFKHEQITPEEHYLIPHHCHQEIKDLLQKDKEIQRENEKIEAWNKLSKVQQNLCRIWQVVEKVLNPIFSITPSSTDTWSTVKFYGVHMIALGALFTSAYSGNSRFIIVASIGYFVYLSREMYLKSFSYKGV